MNFGMIKKGVESDAGHIVVTNRETTTIPLGTPVVFVMDGTKDGADVQKPSSSNASKAVVFPAGILLMAAAPGSGNTCLCYGLAQKALVSMTVTRSATSAAWVSNVGMAVGDVLTINTVGNVLEFFSAGSQVKAIHPFIAAQSVVSATTIASTVTYAQQNGLGGASSDTIAYVTSLAKVFVRVM
jgi:hypothetical protein